MEKHKDSYMSDAGTMSLSVGNCLKKKKIRKE
jgi:hypothetical protein